MSVGQGQQGQQPTGGVAPMPQGQPAETHVTPPAVIPPTQQVQPAAQPPAPVVGQGQPASGAAAPTQVQPSGDQIHHLPDSAFRRIKDEAADKGGRVALEELAQANGYDSVEEMQAVLKGKKPTRKPARRPSPQRKPATAAPQTDPNGEGVVSGIDPEEFRQFQRDMRLMQKRMDKQVASNADLTTQVKRSTALNRRLKAERNAVEAEMLVRETAARVGIRDMDYAMRLMTRDLQGKSEEDLKSFSEEKYFADLRETHPYLFNEVSRPATTGNGAGTAPGSPPNPGAAGAGAAAGGQVDVRQMKPEEFRKHLQSRGLNLSL